MESSKQLIPIFPLSVVLFPEEMLPLHIFEPRYKAMIADVTDRNMDFGVVLEQEGKVSSVGCTANITKRLREYDEGELDIMVRGGRKFQLNDLVEQKPYLECVPTFLAEEDGDRNGPLTERLITQHMRLLELAGRTVRPALYQDVDFISYVVARNAGLDLNQKQAVLEMLSENDRIEYLVDHMEQFIPQVEQIEAVRKKVQSNGHFQDFPPE